MINRLKKFIKDFRNPSLRWWSVTSLWEDVIDELFFGKFKLILVPLWMVSMYALVLGGFYLITRLF